MGGCLVPESAWPVAVAVGGVLGGTISALFFYFKASKDDVIADLRKQRDRAIGVGEGAVYVGESLVQEGRTARRAPPRRRTTQ